MKRKIVLAAFAIICLGSCNHGVRKGSGPETTSSGTSTNMNVPENGKFVYGVDLSKYQGDEIDFLERKKDTLTFVFCRATEGITMTDPDFKNNWRQIGARGFTRGTYHFYHSEHDPLAQAHHYLSVVGKLDAADFPPIVDVENSCIAKDQAVEPFRVGLLQFLNEVKKLTGRTPVIYTNIATGSNYLADPAFADYPLWIAHYQPSPPNPLPGAWKGRDWLVWQKSKRYVVDAKKDDFDVFNGSAEEMSRFISTH